MAGPCREVSIRIKCMDRCTEGTKSPGCCIEVSVSGGSDVGKMGLENI